MPGTKRVSGVQKAIRRGGKDPDRKVLYPINPGPQFEFMMTNAEEVLYGGAAGGGKSYGLRAYAVSYCMTYPGSKGVLFRQSFRQLEETHLIEIQKEVPESIAHYAAGPHDLVFNNGSLLMFRFCEKDEDARSYDTAEFDFELFDELSHFTKFQYTYLTSRCRSTRPGWIGPRIRSGATPLGRGHAWVKARWVDAAAPMEIWTADLSEGGMTRQFIPARVTDNPILVKSDPKYLDRLHALPYEEYRAKALGDWDVFTGQFLVRWRQKIHIIEPFDIDPEWDLFLCVDYGFNKPYAALWFARPPGTDTAFVYREQYGPQVTLKEQVRRAKEAIDATGEKLKAVILDPSMMGKVNVKGERITPMSDSWTEKFGNHCPVIRGNNERVPGWRLMREMVDWKETPSKAVAVPPRLFIFNTCSNTARTLPLMIVDKHNPEDVDTDGEDHAPDALRYGLRHAFEGGGKQSNRPRVKIGRGGITVTRR